MTESTMTGIPGEPYTEHGNSMKPELVIWLGENTL